MSPLCVELKTKTLWGSNSCCRFHSHDDLSVSEYSWYNRKVDSVRVVYFTMSSFIEHVSLYRARNRITWYFWNTLSSSRHCFSAGHWIGVCSRMLLWVIMGERHVVVFVLRFRVFCGQDTAGSSTSTVCRTWKEQNIICHGLEGISSMSQTTYTHTHTHIHIEDIRVTNLKT